MAKSLKQRTQLMDRCAFLKIELGGKFPSNNDMSSALKKATGSQNFSQYLAAQGLTKEFRAFRKKRRDQRGEKKDPKQLTNCAGQSDIKVEASDGGRRASR